MAKSQKLEAFLAQLNEVRDQPNTEKSISILRQVIGSKYSVAVAQAAKVVGKHKIRQLAPDLADAFDRFMTKPEKTDANCLAKSAIAQALNYLDFAESSLYLQGIHHIQLEPVWGGTTDTAPKLRGICAFGLVRIHYPDLMLELADLLSDPESEARIGAAHAIAYSNDPRAIPLLRLRAKVGDEPQVMSEYFRVMLDLVPEQSMEFVAQYLYDKNRQLQELVALALGESYQPQALAHLIRWYEQTQQEELQAMGLLAIAMLRNEEGIDYLLSLIKEGQAKQADNAIQALHIYRQDEQLWKKVDHAQRLRNQSKR
ncbi:MAG: HEAT repeat domain-containing protein [Acaryochloris sp. RU_4_1]|nr:HEAT repeat domain-containing protein [Acaryochloris sp. RU_4_1]NJR56465.1 HEAT repeat domain-containing protein [Acaryochloris sp. CRU_2_0]